MTQPNDDGTGVGTKTFTQAEVDAVAAAARKRTRDEMLAKYADYDELKTKATQADADKGKLDQVLSKLTEAEARANKAEIAQTRAAVAAKMKLPAGMARRLTGSTAEELEADAAEMLAELKAAGGTTTDDAGAADDGKTTNDAATTTQTPPARPRSAGRPRETLQTGAPVTRAEPEETDPLKLAALIPRR